MLLENKFFLLDYMDMRGYICKFNIKMFLLVIYGGMKLDDRNSVECIFFCNVCFFCCLLFFYLGIVIKVCCLSYVFYIFVV